MSTFLHKNILITGGASGIGRLLAERSAQEGISNIILWDIDAGNLQKTVEFFSNENVPVHAYVVDLTIRDEIYSAAEMVAGVIGPVDILVNSAGVVTGKQFHLSGPGEIQQTIDVNVLGALHTTRAFLPGMIKQKSGHIVNISSAVSLMANPKMSTYVASKWALTGWSESLRLELEAISPNLKVTTVQPSFINTGMFKGVEPPLWTPLLDPEMICDTIISAIKRNRIIVREPFMVKLVPILKGLLPTRLFDYIAGKIFHVYRSMDTFTGRKKDH